MCLSWAWGVSPTFHLLSLYLPSTFRASWSLQALPSGTGRAGLRLFSPQHACTENAGPGVFWQSGPLDPLPQPPLQLHSLLIWQAPSPHLLPSSWPRPVLGGAWGLELLSILHCLSKLGGQSLAGASCRESRGGA